MACKYTATIGGRYPCVEKILSIDVASGSIVRIIIVVRVGGNYKDIGGDPYNIPK